MKIHRYVVLIILLSFIVMTDAIAQRQMEWLDRGLVAIPTEEGVFLSWRLLGTEAQDQGFDVYRKEPGKSAEKVSPAPIVESTNYLDIGAGAGQFQYFVRLAADESDEATSELAEVWQQPYWSVPLQTPEGYTPNDASVGDLTGDGRYEIVVHMRGRAKDNSHKGFTDEPILHAYTLGGELLWEINLGKNIREGAHYTQFMVYDLDGNGRAEIACKTADGTIDGAGIVIGDATADWRNEDGYILSGPEYLTVFDGFSGKAKATVEYIPARHPETANPSPEQLKAVWGDGYGNRVDRFLAGIAYLDGERPSLIMTRGYYTRTVIAAWQWREGKLTEQWVFDSDTPGNEKFGGQGYHSLAIGDVDGDGKDEIVFGSMVVDNNGSGLYSTELGHGDAMHMSNINPDREGMEIFGIHEHVEHAHGANLRDAATGEIIWSYPSQDVARGLSIDIDPNHPGMESWALGDGLQGVWNVNGEMISAIQPASCNMGIWWDGDLLRELLDGVNISKWDYEAQITKPLFNGEEFSLLHNNGTKANPALSADIFGDWREELIARTADGQELRIFSTTIPSSHRLYTLMHNPQYRLSIAWQNVGYNQPPHPDYFLGHDMEQPPKLDIRLIKFETEL